MWIRLKVLMLTFGSMHAGTTNNVIKLRQPNFLHGTIRTLTMEMNHLTKNGVKAIAEEVATALM